MCSQPSIQNIDIATSQAVAHYWTTRKAQQDKQMLAGHADQGARAAVTGGAQMDGFIQLFTKIITDVGINSRHIFFRAALELPGYFRPTKEWDLLVVKDSQLVLAIEAKSQVGPSFGNNFNNRTEEAMGSALDLWTAFREEHSIKALSHSSVISLYWKIAWLLSHLLKFKEPHFKVFPEFVGSSYSNRYELFCRKLVRERHYSAAAFITSQKDTGLKGTYREPADDLSMSVFMRTLVAHLSAYV